jgi:serine/threonine protein kinase
MTTRLYSGKNGSVWRLQPGMHPYDHIHIVRKCFTSNRSKNEVEKEHAAVDRMGELGTGAPSLNNSLKSTSTCKDAWTSKCECYIDMNEVMRFTQKKDHPGLKTDLDFQYDPEINDIAFDADQNVVYNEKIFELRSISYPRFDKGVVQQVRNEEIILKDGRVLTLNKQPSIILVDHKNILAIARDIAHLIEKLTVKGFAHADLKLDNLGYFNGTLVGIDWGSFYDKASKEPYSAAGTAKFWAPEHLFTEMPKDKCDIFSLGMIVWDILAPGWFDHMESYEMNALIFKMRSALRLGKFQWNTLEEYLGLVCDKTDNITAYITDIRNQNEDVMKFIDACVQRYDKRELEVKLIDDLAELNSKQKLLFTPGKQYGTRELHRTGALKRKTLFFGRWNKRIL